MAKRQSLILIVFLAVATFGLFVGVPTSFAVDPIAIACPSGQTVWLDGKAAPNEALLIYLSGRAVGGGSADRSGSWRLPLKVNERSGIYPVEVRGRASRLVVGRFSCYVNVALDNAPTATLESQPAAQPSTQSTARPSTLPTLITVARTPTLTPSATPTTSTTGTGGTPSTTTTSGTATSGTTTATPSATVTIASNLNTLKITDIVLSDPNDPELTDYVEITNSTGSVINIGGWRIVNVSRGGSAYTYTFPTFNVPVGKFVILFGGDGEDDLDQGDFYWKHSGAVWRAGDVAELYNSGSIVVSRCKISENDSTGGCVTP